MITIQILYIEHNSNVFKVMQKRRNYAYKLKSKNKAKNLNRSSPNLAPQQGPGNVPNS